MYDTQDIQLNDRIIYWAKDILDSPNMQKTKDIAHHGDVSVYQHCVKVTNLSLKVSDFLHLPVDEASLIRGALLHDYFLYDWHENEAWHRLHGFKHPGFALDNAMAEYNLNKVEQNIIKRHMFPLTPIPPRYLESIIVCLIDKICAISDVTQSYSST